MARRRVSAPDRHAPRWDCRDRSTVRYRTRDIRREDGTVDTVAAAQEQGINLRCGLDVVRIAWNGEFDVALIFSQDQDLDEVAREIRAIAGDRGCWLKIASAIPYGPKASVKRGIEGADWIRPDDSGDGPWSGSSLDRPDEKTLDWLKRRIAPLRTLRSTGSTGVLSPWDRCREKTAHHLTG